MTTPALELADRSRGANHRISSIRLVSGARSCTRLEGGLTRDHARAPSFVGCETQIGEEVKMRSMLVCMLAMQMLTTANANAAENTHSANYMLPYCKLTAGQVVDNPSDSYLVGRCVGLVEGVVNMSGLLKAMQAVGDIPHLDPLLCAAVPEQVTIEQALTVVVRYHCACTRRFA
jgi:hypothetical protein